MDYILMHRELSVAEIGLDEATCSIQKIGAVYAPEHVPVGVPVKKGQIDRAALNEWWRNRAIPASRQGIREALEALSLTAPQQLLDKSLGLSLSDQYWICPACSPLRWVNVNFFDNAFSGDVGSLLFGEDSSDRISLLSPDNTSDGWLRKKWEIIDGRRCLLKGGSAPAYQEPLNEVLASMILRRLSVPHVEYSLLLRDELPYCLCEDFITSDTELVSAWYIMQNRKKENHVSVYRHYLDCCDRLGIPGMEDALDRMLVLDYLIVNEDRHQNNFGAVRRADTLEWLGAAPIYDSGSSMWFDQFTVRIRPEAPGVPCKPFKNSHEEQLKLVTSFDWVDFGALEGVDEEFHELLKRSPYMDEQRRDALCRALKTRIRMLSNAAEERAHFAAVPSWEAEVRKDTAYSGSQEANNGRFTV